MSYHIYSTPGFILESRSRGEAGKSLAIFTRDLGLVFASAQGIRFEKSKLRYHTQDYSWGFFSMVRGKETWRLTSAQPISLESDLKIIEKENLKMLARIGSVLKRLLQGEGSHPELFKSIEGCAKFLAGNEKVTDEQRKTLESLTMLRILHGLGYIGKDTELERYYSTNEVSNMILDDLANKRISINKHVNKALKESHL